MLKETRRRGIVLFSLLALAFILACGVTVSPPNANNPPSFDPTKAALELQATAMSLQLTQASLNSQPLPQATLPSAQAPAEATIAPLPTSVPPTPTQDLETQIKSAKILVYENTDARGFGMWIQEALDGMNLTYTQTGSYSGRFMENLNSGIKWDLIIVGAEDKDVISGEFWDVISQRLSRDKAALIAEVWNLDTEANGPIKKILDGCGVRYQANWNLADSIYWWDSTNPIFNEPNVVLPLLHYNRYWANQTGDKMQIGSGGDATLLAGLSAAKSTAGAVLTTCFQGRVIIQTFSDHDYSHAQIVPLWQNYIYNTLKNHFAVTP